MEKSALTAQYYARTAPALLADRPVELDGTSGVTAWVGQEPMGVVLAVRIVRG